LSLASQKRDISIKTKARQSAPVRWPITGTTGESEKSGQFFHASLAKELIGAKHIFGQNFCFFVFDRDNFRTTPFLERKNKGPDETAATPANATGR